MKRKPDISAKAGDSRDLHSRQKRRPMMAALYRRAEVQLRKRRKARKSNAAVAKSALDTRRLLHELQVHQVELEMQNAEIQEARDRMETLLAKYTDLYDFAPVGYFSLDEEGRILEANLTGAALLGAARSRLINRRLPSFVAPANRPDFLDFLACVFIGAGKRVFEATLRREDGSSFWANFHGTAAISVSGPLKSCRVVVSDITALKESVEAQRRLEALAVANRELKEEIIRRQTVEESLKKSEQHYSQLLDESRVMQEELRHLSRQVLQAQEEERKRISRELHDVIAQTLTGINIRLATLKKEAGINPRGFERNIALTQQLVEKSVEIVHRFARELRPAVLDDLGLVAALHSFMKSFTARTGVHIHLTAFAGVEQLEMARRTVLFRVAQEALTNVARHAHASRVEVSIQKQPEGICMKIKDDGKSFEVQSVMLARGAKRLGLLGMRERLEMVGGRFEVESAVGQGTTVIAQIPSGKAALVGESRMLKPEIRPSPASPAATRSRRRARALRRPAG
jgi:PAS domain S-box-containing protein